MIWGGKTKLGLKDLGVKESFLIIDGLIRDSFENVFTLIKIAWFNDFRKRIRVSEILYDLVKLAYLVG